MKMRHSVLALAATGLLTACGGGGGSGTQGSTPTVNEPPSIALGATFTGTIDSATDVDAFKLPVMEEGSLTIAATGNANPNIRVLDASGAEIPGRSGSYIVLITAEILAKGYYVIVEIFGGTVGESYSATTSFNISTPQTPTDGNGTGSTKDAGQLLADGDTLPVRIVGVRQADEEGTTTAVDNIDFSIRRNSNGEYVVNLQGRNHTFTVDQLTQYGASYHEPDDAPADQQGIWFGYHSGNMSDLNSGHSNGDHYLAFRVGKEIVEVHGSDPELETFAIVGNPTADFSGLSGTSATYAGDGFALLDFWATSFPMGEIGQDYRERYTTRDVTLTADFSIM